MTNTSTLYDPAFYRTYEDGSVQSAREVAPLVMRMVAPSSVIDVGCGVGTWLQAFAELGANRILGIDGSYVDRKLLRIPEERFVAHDLATELPVRDNFDLVISLEVAEHLAADQAAGFVAALCRLGPVVLFSAAIPFQGGTGHVNEQWPEYWAALFARNGYVTLDCIRSLVWDNEKVAHFYAQNMLLFVRGDRLDDYPQLSGLGPSTGPLARVHPRKWQQAHDPRRQLLRPVLKALPHAALNALKRRVNRVLGSPN